MKIYVITNPIILILYHEYYYFFGFLDVGSISIYNPPICFSKKYIFATICSLSQGLAAREHSCTGYRGIVPNCEGPVHNNAELNQLPCDATRSPRCISPACNKWSGKKNVQRRHFL